MVDEKLYDFIEKCNQFDIYVRDNKEIECNLFVNFYDLQEFVEVLGPYAFDDGNLENVYLGQGYVVVDIVDILDGNGGIKAYTSKFTNYKDLSKSDLEILKNDYRYS